MIRVLRWITVSHQLKNLKRIMEEEKESLVTVRDLHKRTKNFSAYMLMLLLAINSKR